MLNAIAIAAYIKREQRCVQTFSKIRKEIFIYE
jgi:hypothetical protein